MVFTGIYEHTIDAKNRLAIPSEIRKQLQAGHESQGKGCLYVTPDEARQALCVWPGDRFEQRAEQLDQSPRSPRELLPYERLFFSLASRTELDKQGRIRIAENLLQMTEMTGDVTVVGVNDHLEIWNREAWQAYMNQMLEQRPELLMHPRQAMRDEALVSPTKAPTDEK